MRDGGNYLCIGWLGLIGLSLGLGLDTIKRESQLFSRRCGKVPSTQQCFLTILWNTRWVVSSAGLSSALIRDWFAVGSSTREFTIVACVQRKSAGTQATPKIRGICSESVYAFFNVVFALFCVRLWHQATWSSRRDRRATVVNKPASSTSEMVSNFRHPSSKYFVRIT